MKKMLLAFVLLFCFGAFVHAQSAPAQTSAGTTKAKKPATTTTTKPATSSTAAKPATTAKPATAAAAGPVKKDGTADMRYKSNKDAAKKTPATVHTKKDGTPDKRYKENK
jgi:hypothetical protein